MKRLLMYLPLMVLFVALSAFAENNAVMKVHVTKTIAIPGNVLAPGDYTFRLVDLGSSPFAVAIASADSKTVYGFVPVFKADRNSGGESEIRATEPDDSGLARIDSWYFPGQQTGYRFIYSKQDVRKADMLAEQLKSKGSPSGL